MFTDQPVTPMRLEVLIDLISANARAKVSRKVVHELLQPDAVVGDDASRVQAKETIRAAIELDLIREEEAALKPNFSKNAKSTRDIVLDAIDNHVLSGTSVEPYFGAFYSYLLHLNEDGAVDREGVEWAVSFQRDVYQGRQTSNPFNPDKYTGLKRWLAYAGLGWFDPAGTFQPNPYFRLRRALPKIFGKKARTLSGNEFMASVAETCPELDGGRIYNEATRHIPVEPNRCSLGLSLALLGLHDDGLVKLHCPADARGWDISRARPKLEGSIKSTFLVSVEIL